MKLLNGRSGWFTETRQYLGWFRDRALENFANCPLGIRFLKCALALLNESQNVEHTRNLQSELHERFLQVPN